MPNAHDNPGSRPVTTKGRETRQRILDSAESLFAERGYARVRIADITDAAGLSPGAFYRYFTDRREVMLELLRSLAAEVFDFVRVPWDSQDPISSVRTSTERYFEFYVQRRALFGLMVELSQTDSEVAAIWAQSKERFYSRIAKSVLRGIETGALRSDLDVELAAELLGSMSEFYAFQRFVLPAGTIKPVPIQEAAHTLAEIWARGVTAGPPE